MKNLTKYIVTSVALLMTISLAGCLGTTTQNTSDKISVAVSMYPEAFLTEHIGGDFVSTYVIVPVGVEPHDFEPSPSDLSHITNSKLFIYHGANIDLWASRIADELDTSLVHVLNASSSVSLLNDNDPHFWLDPVAMQSVAKNILKELILVDPSHTAEYEKNAAILISQLESLHNDYAQTLRECRVRTVATSHSAFAYLAQRYAFVQLPISGISPNIEPSVRDMQNLIAVLREKNIRYVTFETLASSRISETIANEVGAQSLILNPIEGLTTEDIKNNHDYFSLMRENLKTLKTVMECT